MTLTLFKVKVFMNEVDILRNIEYSGIISFGVILL